MPEVNPEKQITLIYRGKAYSIKAGISAAQALKHLELTAESALLVKDGELITEDTILKPGDHVRVVPVISGGNL